MPQVFVSYARSDKREVAKLVAALRRAGFEPWWDDAISPGASWEQTIEEALARAGAVIVCWSATSVGSENVRSEARVARARGVLAQVFLDGCEPPLFFGERQGIDLTNWNGSIRHRQFDRLEEALRAILNSSGSATPVQTNRTGRRALPLPPRTAIFAGAAVAALVIGSWWWERSQADLPPTRVAVQPIEALGGVPALASTASGLTDQIVTALDDGHIPTVSRSDSDSLKGGDSDAKLKALGIGYTVNGTVESSGDTLHARIHLDDRVRHASLWSYERTAPARDAPSLNYAVAHSIAGVISCAYRALGPSGLTDTELLSRYLRVCDLFVNHDDAGDAKSTFELLADLRIIMAKAPDFAPAQSDFAKFAAYLAPRMPADQARGVRAESARAARRALELDPHSADAYVAQEMLLPPTQWARREALLRKAVSVDPNWPHSNGFLAILLTETGRMREAATYGQRAAAADLQIDWKPFGAKMACDAGQAAAQIPDLKERLSNSPADADLKWALRWCMIDAGQIREARATEDPAALGTMSPSALRQAAEQALVTGRPDDRAKALVTAKNLVAADPSLATFAAVWSAALGDSNTAFRLLADFDPGYSTTQTTEFLFVPQADALHRDPRFFALMKRYGLAQFWQSTGRWPDFCAGRQLDSCKAAVAAQLASR